MNGGRRVNNLRVCVYNSRLGREKHSRSIHGSIVSAIETVLTRGMVGGGESGWRGEKNGKRREQYMKGQDE